VVVGLYELREEIKSKEKSVEDFDFISFQKVMFCKWADNPSGECRDLP